MLIVTRRDNCIAKFDKKNLQMDRLIPDIGILQSVNEFSSGSCLSFRHIPSGSWRGSCRGLDLYRLDGFPQSGILVVPRVLRASLTVQTKLRREVKIWGTQFTSRAVKLMWAN